MSEARAGRGVHVHDEAVRAGGVEDCVELRLALGVVGPAAEQEAGLERDHARLAGQGERRGGALGVLRPRRDPQPAADPVVAGGAASSTSSLKEKETSASGTP